MAKMMRMMTTRATMSPSPRRIKRSRVVMPKEAKVKSRSASSSEVNINVTINTQSFFRVFVLRLFVLIIMRLFYPIFFLLAKRLLQLPNFLNFFFNFD